MHGFEPLSQEVKTYLQQQGINPDLVVLAISTDLDLTGRFAEVWLVVTKEQILVLTGERKESATRAFWGSKSQSVWEGRDLEGFTLASVEEVRFQSLTTGGYLALTRGGQEMIICRCSQKGTPKLGRIAPLLEKLRKGEELTQEDLSDRRPEACCPKCGLAYPEPERAVCPKCLDRRSLFLRVMSFMPRYKRQITWILVCMFASAVLALFSPYIGGRILFDEALTPGGRFEGQVGLVVLMTFSVQLLSLLIGIAYGRINSMMTAEVVYDLKTEVFEAMQRLSMRFFSSKQTGTLMTRVNNDATHLQYFFHDGMPYFIVNSFSILGITTMMLWMNWQLALLVLLPAPIMVFFMKKLFPRLWAIFSRRHRKASALNSLVNDSLTGMRVVKAFGKEKTEVSRFSRRNNDVYDVSLEAGNLVTTAFPIIGFLMGLGGLVVWGVGGWQVINGQLTFGTLMTFTAYLGMLYGPLEFMTHIVDWWSSCMNSAQRIFEILDAVPDVAEAPGATPIPYIQGDVHLKQVTFGYEPNTPVLHGIEMDVKAGEMIGLVGPSGAGKSTIANLISRLYDVDEGSISIDGVDVRKLVVGDLRAQVGMVLQETYLFVGTVAENIAYAKPDASMEEIITASQAANAHNFIMKLPDGYDTVIGRHGQNFSGGERQRISIARAILHDPRILILDEATASVDTETERQIQQALERLTAGRTTFNIAHRLSTLRNAHRLVVIEGGKIVETGTHEELLEKKEGVYHRLYEKQKEALKIRGLDG